LMRGAGGGVEGWREIYPKGEKCKAIELIAFHR
jgi:hypothetical protein